MSSLLTSSSHALDFLALASGIAFFAGGYDLFAGGLDKDWTESLAEDLDDSLGDFLVGGLGVYTDFLATD